jgi:A/G-specific adenine glycosylase
LQKEKIINKILEWYSLQKRELPWRSTKNPYRIWISEIILQQTRIAQGLPYYHKFVEKYPTLQCLADASESEVLRMWQGLGYYTRARNMLLCAKTLQTEHGGHFPETFEELRQLKGIGDYTAAAIASFAYGRKVAVVDGNVFRVLSRVFGMGDDITSTMGKKNFNTMANYLVPEEAPDVYNQAIMEFGALQCVPKNPKCEICPLSNGCFAFRNSSPEAFPVKTRKPKNRKRYFFYFVIKDGEYFYMKLRGPGDIWTGLYDFFMVESDVMKGFDEVARMVSLEFEAEIGLNKESAVYKHLLTHQTIYAQFFQVIIGSGNIEKFITSNNLIRLSEIEIEGLPKPNLISNFLNRRFF